MKTRVLFLATMAFFILCYKTNTCYAQSSQRLLVGKWKSGSFLSPDMEFNTDSTAKLGETPYKYFVKDTVIYLKNSKGEHSSLNISKLKKDTLEIVFTAMGSTVKIDYYRMK